MFAEAGYRDASLRRIAAVAEVDAALISHYFGSKDELFAEAMALPFDPGELAERVFGPGIEGAGERLCAAFLALWESDAYGRQLRGLMRAAASDERAAERFRGFVQSRVLPLPGEHLAIDRPRQRMALIAAHLVGIAFLRYVLAVEPIASTPRDDLVRWVGPVVQQYLSGDLASPGDGGGQP